MATSSVYTIRVTASDLIKGALRAIGAKATGETPSGAENKEAIEALNYLIKQWEGPPNYFHPGNRMWQRKSGLLTLTADQGEYTLTPSVLGFDSGGTYEVARGDTIKGNTSAATAIVERVDLGAGTWAGGDAQGSFILIDQSGTFESENLNIASPDAGTQTNVATISQDSQSSDLDIIPPMEILTAVLRHTSTDSDTPMEPLTLEEYQEIGNKSSSVTPTQYYYERQVRRVKDSQIDTGKLYLNGKVSTAAASAYKIYFIYRQSLEIIDNSADEFDIESSYFRALKWALAKELCPEYGKSIPPDVRELAIESMALAQTFQPDDCVDYFQPGVD